MKWKPGPSGLVTYASIAASTAVTAFFYRALPERLATHWNASGQADGTSGKALGAFLLPAISAALSLLLFVLPSIDPMREGFSVSRKAYDRMVMALAVFFFLLQMMILSWNLGVRFDFSRFLMPALGALFFSIGTFLPGIRRNWFAGIRTPWTLSSEEVWTKTHVQAGAVFRLIGVAACFGALFPRSALALLVIPTLVGLAWLTFYSYLAYRRALTAR